MRIGYARVSTLEQDHELQVQRLLELGVNETQIYVDHGFTGKTMTRDGIGKALAAVREGDQLVIPKMDRLARNTLETLQLVQDLERRGVTLNVNGSLYDPHDPMGKLFFTIMAAVAEAEGGWISLRTKEAMQRPAVRARLKGKKPKLSPNQDAAVLRQFEEDSVPAGEIASSLNISRASVYRALERARAAAVSRHG